MSTQQIPTGAQLDAARKILWHQGTAPGRAAVSPEEDREASNRSPEDELADELSESPAGESPELEGDDEEADGPVIAGGAEEDEGDGDEAEGNAGLLNVDEDSADNEAEGDEQSEPALTDDDGLDGHENALEMGGDEDTAETEVVAPASAAVKTIEGARALIERAGLMPFVPHAALSAAPSPSFVEATLGRPSAAPTLAESATARSLLARLIAEGSAVGLNLLGAPGTTGEAPDFVVSTSAFPYVFTLRGDKGWKQLPETSGANKVSPLAVNTYALLVEGGPQSAYALTGELGKGLTEPAVLRALSELWQQLRVIPVPQSNGKPTLWEPITSRLLRQVKAGANAGQPTALSALISLYLGQAMLATEDEIEVFLSTVAPRSRVRDVVHALMAAQELESMAIGGKQNVHIAGELPDFDMMDDVTAVGARPSVQAQDGPMLAEDGSRIRRMVKSSRPAGERAQPFRKDRAAGARGFADRPGGGTRVEGGGARGPGSGARAGAGAKRTQAGGGFARGEDRPGRPPFAGNGAGGRGERPSRPGPRFDRPWEENRRPSRPATGDGVDMSAAPQENGDRPRPAGRGRAEYRSQGDRPRRTGDERPAFGRQRDGANDGSGRPARASFDRAGGSADRPRFGSPRQGGFTRREDGSGARSSSGDGSAKPRSDRGERFSGGDRGERRPFRPAGRDDRQGGVDRPRGNFGDSRGAGSSSARPGGFGGARRGEDRQGGAGGGGFRPGGPGADREGNGASRPPFRRFDAPRDGDRPFRPARRPEGGGAGSRGFGEGDRPRRPAGGGFPPRAGGFARDGASRDGGARPFRPAGGSRFAAGAAGDSRGPKRPFVKREGAGPARPPRPGGGAERAQGTAGQGPFDKFRDGNKPWGKRPPKRKIKPEGEEG